MTQIIAKYYVGDTLVAQNELAKTADLTADVEKMKPQLTRPFRVELVKTTTEIITVHTYGDKR
jgi:hypothetical protein